jgi:hypothetical protein
MLQRFGQNIKVKQGDIKTHVRGNLTATVWKDKQNINCSQTCILHQKRAISVMSMENV